jgi:hypothetical protein
LEEINIILIVFDHFSMEAKYLGSRLLLKKYQVV